MDVQHDNKLFSVPIVVGVNLESKHVWMSLRPPESWIVLFRVKQTPLKLVYHNSGDNRGKVEQKSTQFRRY